MVKKDAGQPVLVIGAGVAGLSTALFLQRLGRKVEIIDPLASPGGASFGNGGLISPGTFTPYALPGMLRKVPGWVLDPLGPLAIRPSHLVRSAPWLARWLLSSRMGRVREIAHALHALHQNAFPVWRELAGNAAFDDLVRRTGQLSIWESDTVGRSEKIENDLRTELGVRWHHLTRQEVLQFLPGISPAIMRGTLVPDNGHTINPARLVARLAENFVRDGGAIHRESALQLLPREGGRWMVLTNIGNHHGDQIVVAAGAWSPSLLRTIGIALPLQTERGYHVMMPAHAAMPRLPFIFKACGIGMTPMETGLRIAGTVEITAIDAPPDERRAKALITQAKRLFPDLETEDHSWWAGNRPSTPDSLPVLGPVRGHHGLFLCLGHGHAGMSTGPISGKLVAQVIGGHQPDFDIAPYRIDRFGRFKAKAG